MIQNAAPAPSILYWYSHCMRLSVHEQARGVWEHAPPGKFFKISHSVIASKAIFGPKKVLESPHL